MTSEQLAELALHRRARDFMDRGIADALDVAKEDLRWITVGAAGQPDVELVQEPADQPWGVRDGAVRNPSGNLVRIDQTAR